jgi:hypothetical protein
MTNKGDVKVGDMFNSVFGHGDMNESRINFTAPIAVEVVTAEEAAANGESFAEGRYMAREFADALNAIGIRPTYGIAEDFVADREVYYEEVIKPALRE